MPSAGASTACATASCSSDSPGFEYKACCWRLRVGGAPLRSPTATGEQETGIYVQLELNGSLPVSERRRRFPGTRNSRILAGNSRFGEKQLHDLQSIFARLPHPAACVVGAAAAFAQTREASSSGVLLDRVAATVNEGVVLSSELDEQMLAISERLREQKLDLPPQNVLRQQVLDRLVLQELQMQRADRAGIKVSGRNAEQRAAGRRRAQQDPARAICPAALASQGIDYAELSRWPCARSSRCRSCGSATSIAAHQREPARDRPVPRAAEEDAVRVQRVQRLAHPDRRAARRRRPSSSKKRPRRPTRSTRGHRAAKTSRRLAVAYSNAQTALEGGALGWRKGSGAAHVPRRSHRAA